MPTDQLVSSMLAKKATSARPSDHRLKPKKAIARNDTGIMPIDSRTTLMIINAPMNSTGRSGDIMMLARLCEYISSRNEMEKPKAGHGQNVPQQHRADKHAGGAGEEAAVLCHVHLQEAPHEHLHGRPIDQVEDARPR